MISFLQQFAVKILWLDFRAVFLDNFGNYCFLSLENNSGNFFLQQKLTIGSDNSKTATVISSTESLIFLKPKSPNPIFRVSARAVIEATSERYQYSRGKNVAKFLRLFVRRSCFCFVGENRAVRDQQHNNSRYYQYRGY